MNISRFAHPQITSQSPVLPQPSVSSSTDPTDSVVLSGRGKPDVHSLAEDIFTGSAFSLVPTCIGTFMAASAAGLNQTELGVGLVAATTLSTGIVASSAYLADRWATRSSHQEGQEASSGERSSARSKALFSSFLGAWGGAVGGVAGASCMGGALGVAAGTLLGAGVMGAATAALLFWDRD